MKYLEKLPDGENLTSIKLIFERIHARFRKGASKFSEKLKFGSSTITLAELNCLTRLNSWSKYCNFNNYTRDDAYLNMLLYSFPKNIKETLLYTEILILDKAETLLKTHDARNTWLDQVNSFKNENNEIKVRS